MTNDCDAVLAYVLEKWSEFQLSKTYSLKD